MTTDRDEGELLRSVALQNAKSILQARQRADAELAEAKHALEVRSAELAKSLVMMRATLESTSDGILVTDGTRRVRDYNQKYLTMWRLTPEILAMPEHRHPGGHCSQQMKQAAQYLARIDAIYQSAPEESHDVLEFADGRLIERISRIQFVDGHNVGRVWSYRDITERSYAEVALRQQSEWLRVTLSSIGDAVIATDAKGRVTFLNRVAETLTGWTLREAASRPLTEIFHIVNELSREVVENPAFTALRDGKVVGLANHTILIARDGSERPIDDSAAPMHDAAGNLVGAVLIFRDFTERHATNAERERLLRDIRDNEERYRIGLDVGEIGVWDWDIVTGHIAWSDRVEEIYGMRPGEFDGTLDMFRLHTYPDDAERVRLAIKACLENDSPYQIDFRIVQPSGIVRWIYTSGRVIRDASGIPTRMIGATRDVTHRKQSEDELRQVARRKDEFLALLAHELRNPLAPLRNGLQVIRLAAADPNAVAQARAMMDRQLGHLVRLVDDLLDVSRIGQNKMELRRARILLSEVIDNAVETARPAIEAAGHLLTVSIPPLPIELDADLTRLAQVLSNLLTNSARYTEKAGQIWVSGEQHGTEVVIAVRDTGIGIPADALRDVFDMFSQVDRSIERTTGGLGIGLALVKGLVEMHGGSVMAESAGPGLGSTFTVRLPVALALQPGATAAPQTLRAGADARPAQRILVVDDNVDAARSMARVLKLQGNEVHVAHDGVEAVASAQTLGPQVILMDVGMPRMNGHEAVRRIRELNLPEPPIIIAVTGWGQDGDRAQTKLAGFDGHLVKPVDLPDLEKLLNELTTAKARLQRATQANTIDHN